MKNKEKTKVFNQTQVQEENRTAWQKIQRTFTAKIVSFSVVAVLVLSIIFNMTCVVLYYGFEGNSSTFDEYQETVYESYIEYLINLIGMSSTKLEELEEKGINSVVKLIDTDKEIEFGKLDADAQYVEIYFYNLIDDTEYIDYSMREEYYSVITQENTSYSEDVSATQVLETTTIENTESYSENTEVTTYAYEDVVQATTTTYYYTSDILACNIVFYVDTDNTQLSFINWFISSTYSNINDFFVMTIVNIILLAVLFIFLVCSAGKTRVKKSLLLTMPFDIATILVIALNTVLGMFTAQNIKLAFFTSAFKQVVSTNIVYDIILCAVMIVVLLSINVLYLLNLKVKYDALYLVKSTIIYKAYNLISKNTQSVVKLAAGILVLCFFEFLLHASMFYSFSFAFVFCCFIFNVLVFAAGLYKIKIDNSIEKGISSIVDSDNFAYIDTKTMYGHDKRIAEKINNISNTVDEAVNERMKSEYFKTELITNVGHDIKTPLTSIINYSDLICKEETDNEKIKEYSDVLFRQSNRLKKLIEDLLEASKASTGNLNVDLQPCEVATLLLQTIGEYSEKFEKRNLELICSSVESNIKILADSRHLFRVFENLLNNTCKYAQENTRVYVTVQQLDNKVHIAIKNVSSEPLNITASELMQRFVRGDSSRTSDGNGLGLSIAQSLTQIQGGELELVIDGDLFKAILIFEVFDD